MAATLPVGSSDGRKSFISGWIGRSFLCLSALILHVKLLSSTLVRFPPSPPPLVSLSLFPFQSLNTPRFHCPGEGAPGKAPQAGRPRAYSRHFGVISEVILASFLGLIRVIFASYWSHFLGHFWVIFGSFLGHFWVIIGSLLGHFWVILGLIRVILGLIRVIFASYWSHFSGHFLVIFASYLRHFCVIFASFLRHFCVIFASYWSHFLGQFFGHI